MMASLQPSGPETSNSSAHLRSGWVRVIRVDLAQSSHSQFIS